MVLLELPALNQQAVTACVGTYEIKHKTDFMKTENFSLSAQTVNALF